MKAIFKIIIFVSWCTVFDVSAQSFDSVHVQKSIDIILNHTMALRHGVTGFAMKTFYYLCAISFVLTGIRLIFKNSDIQSFFHILVKYILIIGFFKFIIEKGPEIGASIIDSLTSLSQGGHKAASPYNMIESALDAYSSLSSINFDLYNIADIFIIKTTALAFLILNFLIIVRYVVTYIGAYMLCIIGVLTLGTAALKETRDIAINYIKALFASGLELFTIAFLCAVHKDIIKDTLDLLKNDDALTNIRSHMFLIFLSLLMYALSKTVPYMLSALVMNSRSIETMPGSASSRTVVMSGTRFIGRVLSPSQK